MSSGDDPEEQQFFRALRNLAIFGQKPVSLLSPDVWEIVERSTGTIREKVSNMGGLGNWLFFVDGFELCGEDTYTVKQNFISHDHFPAVFGSSHFSHQSSSVLASSATVLPSNITALSGSQHAISKEIRHVYRGIVTAVTRRAAFATCDGLDASVWCPVNSFVSSGKYLDTNSSLIGMVYVGSCVEVQVHQQTPRTDCKWASDRTVVILTTDSHSSSSSVPVPSTISSTDKCSSCVTQPKVAIAQNSSISCSSSAEKSSANGNKDVFVTPKVKKEVKKNDLISEKQSKTNEASGSVGRVATNESEPQQRYIPVGMKVSSTTVPSTAASATKKKKPKMAPTLVSPPVTATVKGRLNDSVPAASSGSHSVSEHYSLRSDTPDGPAKPSIAEESFESAKYIEIKQDCVKLNENATLAGELVTAKCSRYTFLSSSKQTSTLPLLDTKYTSISQHVQLNQHNLIQVGKYADAYLLLKYG